jgi:ectoine hydroxylase-related dioxygenase (phytanoyl-CoA dioxygenase family)
MPLDSTLQRLSVNGFDVLEGIIPPSTVSTVRDEIVAIQAKNHAANEEALKQTRARGHRIGAQGVGSLRQVINHTQCFAPYLAAPTLMELTQRLFGPYVRISCTDCVVTHPGNERGYWHADWPYNATNASHIPAPYPDALLHLSSLWMLTDFDATNGGTFVVPGSHRSLENPAADTMKHIDRDAPQPTEMQVKGTAGSVLVYDSRMWHAVAPNHSDQDRVALIVRYAPWWLNLTPTMVGLPDHSRMVLETGGKNYESIPLKAEVFAALPAEVKPLYRHWVEDAI